MYRVEWSEGPIAQMASAWLEADSALRDAITDAASQIDRSLQADPFSQGESRPDGRRILLVAPLGVVFRINPGERAVVVLRAWVFRQGRRNGEGGK